MKERIEEVFFTISPDGKILFDVSCNYKKVWGMRCETLKENPESWLDLVHPEDKKRVDLAWDKLLKTGKNIQQKYRIIRPDRSIVWIYTRSFPVNKSGKLEGYAFVSTKIKFNKIVKKEEDSRKKTHFWQFKNSFDRNKNNLTTKDILKGIVLANNQEDLIENTLLNLKRDFYYLSIVYSQINQENKITLVNAIEAGAKNTVAGEKLNFQLAPEYWQACQSSTYVAVADLDRDDRLTPLKEKMSAMGMRGILNIPIKYSGVLLGLLTVFSPKPHHWQEREINTFIEAANYLSLGIRNKEIESALKTSEKRWQLALEATGDGLWDWDIQSDRVLFYQIKEFKIGQISNSIEQWRQRIHPQDLPKVLAAFEDHLARKIPFAIEYRVSSQNGSYKKILNRGQAEWDESGKAVRMVGIESEMQQFDNQICSDLQQSEKRYRQIVEAMTEGVAIFNERREFLFANQQLADLLGCTLAELLKTNPYEFVNEEDKPKLLEKRAARIKGIKERYSCQFRRKDGSQFWAMVSANPILDDRGKYCANLVTLTDISDRKQAEVKIAQTQTFLQTLINNLPLSLFVKDAEGRYITINRSCEQFFGCQESEVIGKTDYDFFPREQADFLRQKDREVFAKQTKVEIPTESIDTSIGRRVFRAIKVPLYDPQGQPKYLMGLAEDITDRQQIQLALEESERRYRQIVETMNEGVWVLNKSGCTTFVNQQTADMLGHTISQMSGRHFREFIDRAKQAKAIEKLNNCRQGIAEKYDFRFRRQDGSDLWAIVSANPICDENGQYQGILNVITDISDRKQSQAKLSLALEAGKIICWEANLITNRVIGFGSLEPEWVNDSWEFSTKELFSKVFTRQERKSAITIIGRAIENQSEFIFEHRCALFLDRWFMMKGKVISDREGQATTIVGISVDISERKQAEIKIQQTEEFLQTLINSLPVPLFVKDARSENFGKLVLLNQNCEQLFGISTDRAMDKTCQQLFTEDQAEFFDSQDREAFAKNQKVDIPPVAIGTKDLGQKILQATKVPLYDLDSKPQYLLCIAEDVTDRHIAQAALQESEARLAGILDNAEDGIISIDCDRRITLFNKGAEKIFGYTTAEILDRPLDLLLPNNFSSEDPNGEIATKIGRRDAVFARRKDGSEFPAEVSISQLKLADSTIFTAIIRDVADRKRAENNLRENKQFLESIFESASEVIWVVEKTETGDFRMLTINQSVEKFTGIPPQQWIDKGLQEIYPNPEIAAKFKSNYEICLQKESSITFEHDCLLSKDEVCFLITISPLHTSNDFPQKRERILAIAVDISDRKRAEQTLLELEKQREIAEMQLRFFSMASHEFRTPLSTILVIVQSLISYLDRLPQEKIVKKLYQLEKVAKRMTEIIDNILKINRAETEKSQIETELLNPEKICISLVKEMQINAGQERQIIFMSQGENKLTPINPKLFNYILTNLLTNAIKYSPQYSTIHVILKSQTKKLILIVKDRGVGIPKSELPQLFEAFHRGKNIENTPGSGLGLTLVKKCVDLHRGQIEVHSKPGKGTTFIVTIPLS